jgi:hypothetical protein
VTQQVITRWARHRAAVCGAQQEMTAEVELRRGKRRRPAMIRLGSTRCDQAGGSSGPGGRRVIFDLSYLVAREAKTGEVVTLDPDPGTAPELRESISRLQGCRQIGESDSFGHLATLVGG